MRKLLLVIGLFMLLPLPVVAQPAPPAGGEVVYAVLFYSPTCPHCHTVIDEHLPVFEQEFGNQLQVLFVDVSTRGGSALFSATCAVLDTADQCGGVPMMAVGDTLLFGSLQIPEQLPGLTRTGLADGGIGLPPVPMLQEAYAASFPEQASATANNSTPGNTTEALSTSSTAEPTIWERLSADPVANAVAVMVLAGILGSLFVVSVYRQQNVPASVSLWGPRAVVIVGLLIGSSLVITGTGDMLGGTIAIAVFVLLSVITWMVMTDKPRQQIIPLVAVTGLVVAGYMFHVESTGAEAVCGAVGNCNAVQQSDYATLFGVPIGLLGIIGYGAILLIWAVGLANEGAHRYVYAGLLVFAILGTVFSAYLTFLEPFVIGATCAWCLTSAVTMLLLMWLVADEGWQSWLNLTER